MNCFIWILLLLGCGCNRGCNRCNHHHVCDDRCDSMIQPRNTEECGCRHHHHHHHESDCVTPPPVPRFVVQEDDCGCNK